MASRVDERGYEQNGNARQREQYAGQGHDGESRAGGRDPRRDDLERPRGNEAMGDDRRFNERPGQSRMSDEQAPARVASALSDAFVTAFERSAALLGENMRVYQDETVRFMTERLEHDTALMEQFGKSRSMFDLFALQQQWFSAATRAYSAEWMRLSKLTGDVTQRNANEARTATGDVRRAGYDAE